MARNALLAREKEFTRQRDALSAERRKLPMVRIEKEYALDGPDGRSTLGGLFAGHPQLIVYHFMFDPDWEEGCKSCSLLADNFSGAFGHLAARDTAFAFVSRAPLAKLEAFKRRMGWTFPWVSSAPSDFNYDLHVSMDEQSGRLEYNYANIAKLREAGKFTMNELPGLSVFLRDGESIFHTYSTYGRGLDQLIDTYNLLDLTPLGRHEDELAWPMAWVRYHDRYAA